MKIFIINNKPIDYFGDFAKSACAMSNLFQILVVNSNPNHYGDAPLNIIYTDSFHFTSQALIQCTSTFMRMRVRVRV